MNEKFYGENELTEFAAAAKKLSDVLELSPEAKEAFKEYNKCLAIYVNKTTRIAVKAYNKGIRNDCM